MGWHVAIRVRFAPALDTHPDNKQEPVRIIRSMQIPGCKACRLFGRTATSGQLPSLEVSAEVEGEEEFVGGSHEEVNENLAETK